MIKTKDCFKTNKNFFDTSDSKGSSSLEECISLAEKQLENPKIRVLDISLLSDEEYEKYSPIIPTWYLEGANEFWLRTAGIEKNCVMGITDDGFINRQGFDATEVLGVRPVMKIENLCSDDGKLQPGSSIGLLGQMWTVLEANEGNALILCNSCITQYRFDVNSNEFNSSHIKGVLGYWLQTQAKKDKSVVLSNTDKVVDKER